MTKASDACQEFVSGFGPLERPGTPVRDVDIATDGVLENGTQISRRAEPRLQTGIANPSTESFWALVLAGGDGTRLQGVTRMIAGAPIPKQYCRILGSRSLLETTLRRIAPLVAAERTLVIINRDHLTIARRS
jgi:Nucleotidyl transferase